MAKIRLMPLEEYDLSLIQNWRNSSKVMPYCRQYRVLSMDDMLRWYDKLNNDKSYNLINDLFSLGYNGFKVGVGGFVRIDWRNRKAELSFYVGEDMQNYEQAVTELLQHIVEYGFKTLCMRKIYWPVYSFNPNLSIYEKTLKREYTAKEEYYWEGKWHDRIVLVAYGKDN